MKALLAALLSVALCAPLAATANDNYPTRPITVVVPYPAGGNQDVALRAMSDALKKELGVDIVVMPVPGAGGVTGTQRVLSSAPDGYTVLVAAQSSITIPSLVRQLRFQWDTPKYLATINTTPMYIGTSRASPKFSSFDEMIEFTRKNPGVLNMAQIGKAGLHEVTMLRIKKRFGVDFKSIPFNGGPPTVTAVLGGHADALITNNANDALLPVVLTGEASPHYPGVKTLSDLGYADLATGVSVVVAVPPETPEPIARKLEDAFAKAVKDPKYIEVLNSLKWTPAYYGRAETNARIKAEAMAVKGLIDDKLLSTSTE
jgi:tripartite-type tricarboxylate transporter receptor subunit TctC